MWNFPQNTVNNGNLKIVAYTLNRTKNISPKFCKNWTWPKDFMKGRDQGCNNIWDKKPILYKVNPLHRMGNLGTSTPTGQFVLMASSKKPHGMAMKLCLSVQNLVTNILKQKWTPHVTFRHVLSDHFLGQS